MLVNVVVRPKIECEEHGASIPFPKEGFDLTFEPDLALLPGKSGHDGSPLLRALVLAVCYLVILARQTR